ncbi:MAG: hypothetical protein MUF43_12980 [Flavobacterium sp.]|jgi:hypothetical protein|nr:hypothetical protein [Flavobacterium sp.]
MEKDKSRKIVLDIVTLFFLKKGFQLYSEPQLNDMFYLNNSEGQITYGFYFKHVGWHTFFKASINIRVVENVLCEIYERNDNDLIIKYPTVVDKSTILGYEPVLTPASKKVETELEAQSMAYEIVKYVKEIGEYFISKYSHLPNVLEKMNQLENEGKYWNGFFGEGGILVGMIDAFLRGLIISKLCNDIDFERKLIVVEEIFNGDNKSLKKLEKLKERLKTVEPIYNV